MGKSVKRIVALILTVCLFSFVGCGKDKDKSKDKKNKTEVTESDNGDFDFDKDIIEADPNEEPEVINYEWTGEYSLENGTGSLKINKVDEKNVSFSIDGKTNEGKELKTIEGNATISEDIGTYQGEDGTIISFIFVQGDSVEVRVYDIDKNEVFAGDYIPN